MDQIQLKANKRDITGKKVRFLRRQGITPVHVFGHGVESVTLQCDTLALKEAMHEAGKTRIINLTVDKSRKTRTVMVRETQKNPLTGELLHVDLYQVIATEKIRAEVPIVLTGEAPALKAKENLLEHELSSIEVECLPAEVPSVIEVDISVLTDSDSAVRVKDLAPGENVTLHMDPEQIVVKIGRQYTERVEGAEEAAAEVAAESEAPAAAASQGGEAGSAEE